MCIPLLTILVKLKKRTLDYLRGCCQRRGRAKWRQPNGAAISSAPTRPPLLRTRYNQENLVARFEETGIAMGDPDADLDALLEEQATLQAKIEDADAWNLQVTPAVT